MSTTMRPIDITPDWQGVFRFAVQLCRDGLAEGDGLALVIEMLEFGARLEAASTPKPSSAGYPGRGG